MLLHRITAVAIVAACAILLRVSIVPKFDRPLPSEGNFSIKIATTIGAASGNHPLHRGDQILSAPSQINSLVEA